MTRYSDMHRLRLIMHEAIKIRRKYVWTLNKRIADASYARHQYLHVSFPNTSFIRKFNGNIKFYTFSLQSMLQ